MTRANQTSAGGADSRLPLPVTGRVPSVPVGRIRALVALLSPDEMTPTAKRMFLAVCDEHDREDEDV